MRQNLLSLLLGFSLNIDSSSISVSHCPVLISMQTHPPSPCWEAQRVSESAIPMLVSKTPYLWLHYHFLSPPLLLSPGSIKPLFCSNNLLACLHSTQFYPNGLLLLPELSIHGSESLGWFPAKYFRLLACLVQGPDEKPESYSQAFLAWAALWHFSTSVFHSHLRSAPARLLSFLLQLLSLGRTDQGAHFPEQESPNFIGEKSFPISILTSREQQDSDNVSYRSVAAHT